MMGFLGLFTGKEKSADKPQDKGPVRISSGMRVEVTSSGGQHLFCAKLMNYDHDRAELYQYSEYAGPTVPEDGESIWVNIRGYHDGSRKAVYMKGRIRPLPKHVWQVEELTVARVGNDRAFFRLDTDLDATVTVLGGLNAGEYHCRLLNISVGGVCINSDRSYHEGDKFLLKVKLMEDRDISMMYCQVMRVTPRDNGRFEYGCRFLEMHSSNEERIAQSIFAAQRKKRARA